MTHETLRAAGRGGILARAAGVLLIGGAALGLTLASHAQSPGAKTADVKKAADPAPSTAGGLANVDEAVKVINDLIGSKWKNDKGESLYQRADMCSDYEYIRRVSLDIIGRIAKVSEIHKFEAEVKSNGSAKARAMLVDRLLASEEYTQNWSTIWTYWLMTRTGPRLYRDQLHLWLEEEMFSQPNMSLKDLADKLVTATGKTNANGAVNYFLANLGGSTGPQGRRGMGGPDAKTLEKEGQFDMVPITSRTIRVFLGYQIQCTQCHDHPFNADWKQKHFWGVNAFFRQTERVGQPQGMNKKGMPDAVLTLTDNSEYNKKGIVYFEKRNGVFLPSEPIFLDGTKLPKESQVTRRQELSRFLTSHKNFSKAYINRMWAHFFSRGFTEKAAADDFGEHNPVMHDELLERLGEMFSGSAGYNPKHLIRWICASEPYQLKAIANKTNDKSEDEVYFSRQLLKAMSPEQLFESLLASTQPKANRNDDEQKKFRADWMRKLTVQFGDDEGNEATYSGTVVQALLLMNGRELNASLTAKDGTLSEALKFKGKAAVDHLFLATLNRPCTQREFTQLTAAAVLKGIKETDQTAMLTDMLWALVNCNEFILNH